jgi:hypothetical protein
MKARGNAKKDDIGTCAGSRRREGGREGRMGRKEETRAIYHWVCFEEQMFGGK